MLKLFYFIIESRQLCVNKQLKNCLQFPLCIKTCLDCYKTQKMCDKVISEDRFMLVYDPDRYKTERTCEKLLMIV